MRFDLRFMALITGLVGISFTLAVCSEARAQELGTGARVLALGGAGVAVRAAPFESVNPAAEWSGGSPVAWFSVEQGHALAELRYVTAAAAASLSGLAASVTVESFGFDAYRRTTAGGALSTAVLPGVRAGLRATLRRHAVRGYGGRTAPGLSVGWTGRVSKHVVAGGAWHYVGSAIKPSDRILPQRLVVGCVAALDHSITLFVAAVHEAGAATDFRMGAEALLARHLAVRIGTGTYPDRLGFGFGLILERGRLDAGAGIHPHLGLSLAVTLSMQ